MSTKLIFFYPYMGMTPTLYLDLILKNDEEVNNEIKRFAVGANFIRFNQRYFLVGKDAEIKKGLRSYVNTLNFPNGGEYFELDQLADVDRIEIAKLLIVHGWHLLNEKPTEVKSPKPKDEGNLKNCFFDNLVKTDETRIPLNILHQIYQRYIKDGTTDSDLREGLQNRGFDYKTFDIRLNDRAYLKELSEQAEKQFLILSIKETKKQKAFSCKLDEKFWKEVSPEAKKENEQKQASDFDLYLQALAEKYKPFYDVEIPEVFKEEDPLKDYVPPEKIPDDFLQ